MKARSFFTHLHQRHRKPLWMVGRRGCWDGGGLDCGGRSRLGGWLVSPAALARRCLKRGGGGPGCGWLLRNPTAASSRAPGVPWASLPALGHVECPCQWAGAVRRRRALCCSRKVLPSRVYNAHRKRGKGLTTARAYTLPFYDSERTALFFTITVHGEAAQAFKRGRTRRGDELRRRFLVKPGSRVSGRE